MNDGIKRQSVLYTPNPQDMMRFNESPPLMQNHQEGMRPNIGEGNKRVSMLHNPQDIQRNLQDKSQSGSVQNQVSGPSTIEDQTSGTKLNVNEVQALGNSNLIFNQDGRPISRNQRESLRESTEDRPNSRTQNQRMSFGEHAEENISRPMSRSQRPNNESGEENRPFSRSQRNTLIESGEDMRPNSSQKKMSIIEYGNESRPISRSQKQTLIESADGTSIEEVQEQSIYQQKEDNYESRNNIPDDMVSYKDDPRNFEMRNEEYHYEQEYNEGYYGDPKGNGPYGYPGSVSSKHSFLMGPIKANVETQTAQENMLAVLSNFDITKMEPYTLEFLRVLEGELSNMRYGIKEVKDGIKNDLE